MKFDLAFVATVVCVLAWSRPAYWAEMTLAAILLGFGAEFLDAWEKRRW
jgi:hypothetical protein